MFRDRALAWSDAAAKVTQLPLACERHLRSARTWQANAGVIENMLAAAAVPLPESAPPSLDLAGRLYQELLEKLRAADR